VKKIAGGALALALVLALATYGAFKLSPWPSVWLIRLAFDKDTRAIAAALEKHVPAGVAEVMDEPYGEGVALDVFRPAGADGPLPAVVWVHGGAYVYGSKSDVRSYLKILAAKGYATVAVGYDLAPGATYPTPVRQLNEALGYLRANAGRLGIDPSRIVLAGDSAGAQIAAQLANVITSPAYARQLGLVPALQPSALRGVILHCGPYGTGSLDMDGPFGSFITTVLWSYFGTRSVLDDPRLEEFSIVANLTSAFPPVFLSVGSADPLAPLSHELAARAEALGVPVDALFFPADHEPPLPHEYQFNLDGAAGQAALERTVEFLASRTGG
jgi:acetyl esterase/lipase